MKFVEVKENVLVFIRTLNPKQREMLVDLLRLPTFVATKSQPRQDLKSRLQTALAHTAFSPTKRAYKPELPEQRLLSTA
jgi:hypothetical protein